MKQETIAHLTQVSPPQVSKIENGKKRATRAFVEIVDDHLEAGGALINLWEDLNKDGHPVPIWFDWPKIEADAVLLTCWEQAVMPGLAQTPAYASLLLDGNEEALDTRLRRQEILKGSGDAAPPMLTILIDELALYRPVGTAQVMKEQLEYLLAMGEWSNVTVQVVLASGEHDGNSGAFTIATMDDRSEVAYAETAIRGITTDDPSELTTLSRTLVALRSRALTQEMSSDLIRKVVQEKWT